MTEEEKRRAKPILFSTPMVEAILDGRKTQTRRVIKLQPECGITQCPWCSDGFSSTDQDGRCLCRNDYKPKYQIGDVLWVRETWAEVDGRFGGDLEQGEYAYVYKASENGRAWEREVEGWKWKSSIFMPKEAARIFLTVTDVWPEQVQDITEEDAIKEGVGNLFMDHIAYSGGDRYKGPMKDVTVARDQFELLWDSLNAKRGYSFESNPFVWVYEFEVVENGGECENV